MELFETHVINFLVETGSIFAPVLFISFHLLRPLFFLLVVVICISGGIIFVKVAVIIFLVETVSIFAPVLFISFHLLRPLFFLPVVVICISGGMIFGTVAGTIYSIIGITLSSIFFYGIIHWMPKSFHKLTNLREK